MKRLIPAAIGVLALAVVAAPSALVTAFATGQGQPDWTQSIYNPSGRALAPEPAISSGGNVASFNFASGVYTALLTTSDKSLTGDLTAATISATFTLSSVTGSFVDQNGDGCGTLPNARLYFTSPAASGPSYPLPGTHPTGPFGGTPSGYYSKSWWSNPASVTLTGNGTGTITVTLDPSGSAWSDWNGQKGDSSPAVTDAFDTAIATVQTIGLSFGGGCFFENGVTTSDGSGTFTLNSFSE